MSMASQLRSRISPLHSPLLSSYLARSQSQYARQAPLLSQSRHLFAGMKYLMDSKSKKSEDVVQNKVAPEGIHGEKILYRGSSELSVRAMFAAGSVNFFYWTYHLVNCIVYQGVIIQGIDFGGQPIWTLFGYIGTGLVFYCNREYANHAAFLVYETSDSQRIGFQFYNMLGFPGRKIEATVGNVRLANTVQYNLGSDSFVPLRVEGIKNNILIDKDGEFYADGRLKVLLQAGGDGSPNSKKIIPIKTDSAKKGTWANQQQLESKRKRRNVADVSQTGRIN